MSQLLPPQVKHWGKALLRPDYRRRQRALARLRAVPRYQPVTTDILERPLEVVDSASFIYMFEEIFEREIYRFNAEGESPYVLDCGSNIGLSVIYFKRLYPRARVVAFEADDEIFAVLKRNAERWELSEVELIGRAVWSEETTLNFKHEGADGGRIEHAEGAHDKSVRTVRLRDYLDRRVDFLKIDIEGAETETLKDCADRLGNVENLFVEYHSFDGERQTLDTLVRILAEADFRLHVHSPNASPQPFVRRDLNAGMDLQLNIFAFRS
ncbi:MAG TPA: FkbM family methyltransferase [Pyrinomonadaceae bacterium]|nr:FkbM family methyltransferase [Pyrinomonadaceae bacterium]